MDIKVLGPGCANCRTTFALLEQVARDKGLPVTLGKVEDVQQIAGYGILATPGVVVDGVVVHAGGVPTRDKVEQWFKAFSGGGCSSGAGGCCGGGSKSKCCG